MNKGFTLTELIIVISIIGLLGIFSTKFDYFFESNEITQALNKIKYDIIFIQSKKLSSSENFFISFSNENNGSYVCFNDLNEDKTYSEDEILIDTYTKGKMNFTFSQNNSNKLFRKIRFNEIYVNNDNLKKVKKIWFNKFGGLKVWISDNNEADYDNENTDFSDDWDNIIIEISSINSNSYGKLNIKALTLDMKVEVN